MREEIEKLIEKYQIQRQTVNDLIESGKDENELSKYLSVHRFISSFIGDLTKLKNIEI